MNGRTCKWLLIGSLILNIFLIGSIAGGAYKLFSSGAATVNGPLAERGLRFAADNLGPERKQAFREALRETRKEARPLVAVARTARSEVRALVAAPVFDREAVKAALDRTREADIALRIRIERGLIDFTETLSPEERVKLAQGMARNGPLRQQLTGVSQGGNE